MMYGMCYFSFTIILFLGFLSNIKDKYENILLNSILFFIIANSLMLLIQWLLYKDLSHMKAFLGEVSMAGCITGLFTPLIVNKLNGYWKALVFVLFLAVLSVHSTTAIAVTAVAMSCYILSIAIKKKEYALGSVLLAITLCFGVGVGYLFNGMNFFNSGERFENQLQIINLSFKNMNHFFGFGGGSYMFLGPSIQKFLGHETMWQHPHSDLIKVFFEQGFIGLLLMSVIFITSLIKSINTPYLFGMVCGVWFYSVVQYPSFLPVHSFICLAIVIRALKQKTC
jgi:hypothetical protein